MPEINVSDIRSLYDELRGLNAARNADYTEARRRYRGEHWDSLPANRYALTINYVRPATKSAVRDLFGRMPGVQCLPQGADDDARRIAEGSEGVIYRCWEQNEAAKVFRRAANNQVLLRRGILYVWWDHREKEVRFRSIDPASFYALKDGERIVECIVASRRLTSELRREYGGGVESDDDGATGIQQGWAKTDGTTMDALGDEGAMDPTRGPQGAFTTVLDYFHRDGTWVRVAGNQRVAGGMLGYGITKVPFIEIENDFPGDEDEPESEIPKDVVELNQYLDILVSQQADIIKKYANPTIIDQGSGQSVQAIKTAVQADGGIIPARKDGNLRFLNWEGPQPAIGEQAERMKGFIHDLTGRPAVAYGEAISNQSGVMTNLAMNPTVAVAADRQVLWGMALVDLNQWILRLYQRFAAANDLSYQGYKPSGQRMGRMKYVDTTGAGADGQKFKGSDIGGWYRNQIKWPSILRTDDPMYVQSVMSQVTSDPPLLSVYDAIELLGHDDAEGIVDRISAQLEDPRFHPDRMKSAIEAANALSGSELSGGMEGLVPPGDTGPTGMAGATAQAAGNPNRDALAAAGR